MLLAAIQSADMIYIFFFKKYIPLLILHSLRRYLLYRAPGKRMIPCSQITPLKRLPGWGSP